jgi:hypothetical protein
MISHGPMHIASYLANSCSTTWQIIHCSHAINLGDSIQKDGKVVLLSDFGISLFIHSS